MWFQLSEPYLLINRHQFQMCCGQMEDHSSRPNIFNLVQIDRDLFTRGLPTYRQSRVSGKLKSMKKIIIAAWNSRSLDEDKLFKALLSHHNIPCQKIVYRLCKSCICDQFILDMFPADYRFNGSVPQERQNSKQQVQGMPPRGNTMHQLRVYQKFKWDLRYVVV